MSLLTVILIILLSTGILQGLVYGVLLWRKKTPNTTANRLLAILLFCFAYRLLNEVLLLFDVGRYDWWYHLTQETNWLYGPLIYLFVNAWLAPDFRVTRKEWIHLVPFVIEVIINNFVRTQNFYWDGSKESLSWAGYWGYVVWMNYPVKYLVASLLLVFYIREAARLVKEHPAVKSLTWLLRILRGFWWYFAAILSIVIIDFIINFDTSFSTFYYYFTRFYYYPLFIGIAGLTYWFGLEGYHREGITLPKAKPILGNEQLKVLQNIAIRISQVMQEKQLYRDPDLSLSSLAAELDVKPYLISKSLKAVLNTRFHDYVNRLRVEELKRLLQAPQKAHFTLTSLAFEAGFNSKASVHRAVKKFEGVSPGDLREKK